MRFRTMDMMLPVYWTSEFKGICFIDNEAAADSSDDSTDDSDAGDANANQDSSSGEGDNVIWPDDWRDRIAGGDSKIAEELGRYAEPSMVGAALVDAKNKIRTNTAKEPLAENATDAETAAWREENGIPAEAAGYFDGLPEGLTVDDDEKPGMEGLMTAMHQVSAPPTAVHAAMGAYYQHLKDAQAAREDADVLAEKATNDELNVVYGKEFRRNMTDLDLWLGAAGDDIKTAVKSSRLPDGTPLGSDPAYIQWMVSQMRLINPLVTVPGLGGGDPADSIDTEIREIENMIQNDNIAYQRDQPMQDRYLVLLEAKEKSKK